MHNPNQIHKMIPLIIFVNGFAYHFFNSQSETMLLFDTVCNIFIIVYVNITTYNQPEITVYTMISMMAYCFNKLLNQDIVHVLFIQWLLLIAYIKSYNYDYDNNSVYVKISEIFDVNNLRDYICDVLDKNGEAKS
jgi:hypothetical protein